jgi:hypothetical protein
MTSASEGSGPAGPVSHAGAGSRTDCPARAGAESEASSTIRTRTGMAASMASGGGATSAGTAGRAVMAAGCAGEAAPGRAAGQALEVTGSRAPAGRPGADRGQVTTPRVRRRMVTSMIVPATARLNTPTRTAVRMSLMRAAAMLTKPKTATPASAAPIPLELVPQPQQTDPGLHMNCPFGAGDLRSIRARSGPALPCPQARLRLPERQSCSPAWPETTRMMWCR